MAQSTDKTLKELIINQMPRSVYNAKKAAGELDPEQVYLPDAAYDDSLGVTDAVPGKTIKVKAVQGGKPTEWETADIYEKPTSGIPKSDLADDVQTSLAKADAAVSLGLTSATPGQIIKVKTVQDGKPTEWEAVDMPSGDKWEKLYDGTIQIEQETMLVEVDIPRSDSAKEFHVYLHFAKNVAQEWDSAKLVQVHVNGAQLGYSIIYNKLTSDFYCFAKQSFDTVRRVEVMRAIGINPETNLSNIATQLLNWSVYEQTNTGKIRISFAAAYAGSIELLVYGRY